MIASTHRLEHVVLCLAAGVLATAAVTAQPPGPPAADLSGAWVLDQKTTSGPEKSPNGEGREGRGGPPGGFGGGLSGGAMSGFGNPAGPPDREKIERQRRITTAELAPPARMVITAAEGRFTIAADDERPETLVPDGKKHLRLTGDGEINTTTRWNGGALVSERHYDEGITATRTYHVEEAEGGGRQLVVTLRLEGGRVPKKAPELRRVYRPQ